MDMVVTVIGAILIFSVIIFVHEFGHFLAARIFGVTVHEFAIGMGPAIWKKQGKGETLYSIRAIPMGGFCQLEGEDEESDSPGAFNNKKPVPRMVILVAGVVMNLVLGFMIVLGLMTTNAIVNEGLPSTVVESVNPEASAASFLQPGDEIVAVNGKRVHIRTDLSFALSQNGNQEATLTVKRDGEKFTESFTPMEMEYEDGSKGYLVGFNIAVKPISIGGILHEAFFQTVWMVKLVFVSLGMLFSGEAGIQDMSGPVGVVSAMNAVAQSGWYPLLFFAAFLAVNIGVMNLLPLPALDGGRILFVLIELIFRKPIPREKEGWIHFIGFALLILLMVYVTWNDLIRIFGR
ncbi:MAG: RIP metalloprotease RseP [Clostridia bacterium]|nr:RIP metalloprotease RseP [Clostridia bacterium]